MSRIEISDALTVAAVDRAVRHRPPGTGAGVPTWAVYEHLGVSSRSRAARLLRARLAALDGRALARGKRHGVVTWELYKRRQAASIAAARRRKPARVARVAAAPSVA